MNREILNIDNAVQKLKISPPSTRVVEINTVGGGQSSIAEVDTKIAEMKSAIERTKESNEKNQNICDTLNKKILSDEDFLKKFSSEKKVWLDQVDEFAMREYTYQDGFEHLYEAKIMKMIFEGILLEKIQESIDGELEERLKNIGDAGARQKVIDKVTMDVTFNNYKRFCFDPWKFKNQVLAAEEYIILEYVKRLFIQEIGNNVSAERYDEEILGKIMNSLDAIKAEAEGLDKNKRSKNLEKIFWPLINTLMIIVFLSIGNKRVKLHRERIQKLQGENKKRNDENTEMLGQIKLLEDLKVKISKETKDGKPQKVEKVEKSTAIDSRAQNELDEEYRRNLAAISEVLYFIYYF